MEAHVCAASAPFEPLFQELSHRFEIARGFCLFVAADGEENGQDLGTLRVLLHALDHVELERDLPVLCRRFRHSETSWQCQ